MNGQTSSAVLLLALTSGAGLRAQPSRADPVDVQSRLGVQLNLNLAKTWDGSVGYEGHMTGNSAVYRGSYLSAELGHALGKHLTVFANYRLAKVSEAVSHRYGLGAELEAKRHHLTLSFRPTFQYQRKVLDDGEQGSPGVVRTRVRAKVPVTKHLTFYGSVEPYFAFTGLYPVDNWRNTAGVQWEIRKHLQLDLHYIYRQDYEKIYNRTYHIFGVEFSIDRKFPR